MILPYIINVALILTACLVFYKLLLRRETFYRVNRYMLITCLAISFALPLLQVDYGATDWASYTNNSVISSNSI